MKIFRPGNDQSIQTQDDLHLSHETALWQEVSKASTATFSVLKEITQLSDKSKRIQLVAGKSHENGNRDLYEFSPVGHITLAQDGEIIEINSTGCEMLGRNRTDIINFRISTFVEKADQQRWNRLKLKLINFTDIVKVDIKLHFKSQNNHKFYGHLFIRNRPIKGLKNGLEIVIADITQQVKIAKENRTLRISKKNLRMALSNEIKIREDEQSRIGCNLHDQIGSDLAAVKSQIILALDDINSGRLPDAHLMTALDVIASAAGSIRSIVSGLNPPELDSLGIWGALKLNSSLVRDLNGIDCECILDPAIELIKTSDAVSAMIFRVVQEAITNVIRHAHASKIIIEAHLNSKTITISIKDDGIGISSNRNRNKNSHGVIGMEERCRLYGGKFSIQGESGKGTVVTLSLPLKRKIKG